VIARTRVHRLLPALVLSLALAPAAVAESPAAAKGPKAAAKAPAASPAEREKAAAAFDAFASQWMDKMQRVEADNRRQPSVTRGGSGPQVSYRGYTDDFRVELRPTGYPGAPFVGLIRYGEQLFTCSDPGATRCGVAYTTPVTEIFRFQDGRWIY
jgi:hypothetical protein